MVGTGFIAGLLHPRYGREEWFSFLAFGLTIGAIYALIALGYTMVYGILRMVNFAHGDVFMFGAYAACFTLLACNRAGLLAPRSRRSASLIAVVMAVAVSGGAGRAGRAHRLPPVPARPLAGAADQHARPVLRAGILGARHVRRAEQVLPLHPGDRRRDRRSPASSVPRSQLVVVLAAVLTMIVLTLIVMRTKIGTAMRAVAEDKDAATLMGIDVDRIIVFTFILGGAMAGIAGLLYGLVFKQISFFMGFFLGVKGFGAAVLGGIGNIPGAMLGGFALGLVESLGPALFLEGLGVHRRRTSSATPSPTPCWSWC